MNFVKPNTWIEPNIKEREVVGLLLGKTPQSEFQILIKAKDGVPLVIENAPFFYDGTPMPTRFWLMPGDIYTSVSKLESAGGIKKVQEEISLEEIQKIHDKYEIGRDSLISDTYEGPRPTGGVGGTRKGVKCLHAHVANLLAVGDDVVGQWALDAIKENELAHDNAVDQSDSLCHPEERSDEGSK